jgi:SAM-dependent methyltransferase
MTGPLLTLVPPGDAGDFILLLGTEDSFGPAVQDRLGYGHVARWTTGAFDLERDFYPYPNAHFKAVVCRDLLETLTHDPMHMMDEIHRVLRPGCHLIFAARRFALDQVRWLLENCGLEVTQIETVNEHVLAAGKKVGPLRERYPQWLYPRR